MNQNVLMKLPFRRKFRESKDMKKYSYNNGLHVLHSSFITAINQTVKGIFVQSNHPLKPKLFWLTQNIFGKKKKAYKKVPGCPNCTMKLGKMQSFIYNIIQPSILLDTNP